MTLVIPVLAFLVVFLFLWGLYWQRSEAARAIDHRLKVYTGTLAHSPWNPAKKQEEGLPAWQQLMRRAGKTLAPREWVLSQEAELTRAGIPMRGEEFLALQFGLTAGLPLLTVAVAQNIPAAVVFGLLGYAGPKLFVSRGKAQRSQKFNDQIVDALAVMANSLRAGFSFMQAMDMVCREMPPPIAEEFARALREINLGKSPEEAMTNLTKRIASEDLDLVVTAVLIQRQVGGNLSEILDIISDTIRERIRIKGEIRTLTAQGRISGMVIALLPVAVAGILMVVSADYLQPLFTDPIGWALIGAAVVSEMIGWLMIKKITNIEI
ncbi:MAG: type II secretion system F family protein [Heliobacteriaceae bacterium]|nr:type II secretion system F family protein [Heliobacteriaceae bacterium]